MAYNISVKHNFETAHRLTSTSSMKCQSIHGHSWWVEVWIEGDELSSDEMLAPYGDIKKAWRSFIDGYIDHGLILSETDPLVAALAAALPNQKLYLMKGDPTTENLSKHLFEKAKEIIEPFGDHLRVTKLSIQETHVNFAGYEEGLSGTPPKKEKLQATVTASLS